MSHIRQSVHPEHIVCYEVHQRCSARLKGNCGLVSADESATKVTKTCHRHFVLASEKLMMKGLHTLNLI